MIPRRIRIPARHLVQRSRLLQLAMIVGFWLAGETIARTAGVPLPGGVIGLGLALVVLSMGGLGVMSMKRGAEWLLADMLLFFVPAVLVLLEHRELFGLVGLKILITILLSTTAVMGVTALTVDLAHRWRLRHGHAPAAE